jgi:predicted nuclease with RNAse H fold
MGKKKEEVLNLLSIDLAGSEKKKSGYAFFNNSSIITGTIEKNGELLGLVDNLRPSLVGIDAPLSIPNGRRNIDEKGKNHFRECDLMLRKLKIKFFPITLGPMRMLAKRGMWLKGEIEKRGIEVMEIFPGASLDVLGIERKNPEAVNRFLCKYFICRAKTVDESDAAIGLFTLWLYKKGMAEELKGKDGSILLPKLDFQDKL